MQNKRRWMLGSIAMALVLSLSVAAIAKGKRLNYRAHLSAPEGVESRAHGQAIFHFEYEDSGLTEVEYRLLTGKIRNVTMAHIHVAPEPGLNGPPVVWLYPDGPPAAPPADNSGKLAEGTFTAADLVGPLVGMTLEDLVIAIEEGRAYVNVHTTAYPSGEIRGDIY